MTTEIFGKYPEAAGSFRDLLDRVNMQIYELVQASRLSSRFPAIGCLILRIPLQTDFDAHPDLVRSVDAIIVA
eukprot:SAG31_NODE_2190_length_6229_cov_11.374388_2_plen_73_part_00